MGFDEDRFDIGNGIRGGLQDATGLLGDLLTGVAGLGVSVGKVSARYAGTAGTLAESPILSAALVAIEAAKSTTGSGAPEDGAGYRESAARLGECVETLIDAEPHPDQWDGSASRTYDESNETHRRRTASAQLADSGIAAVLAIEAEQVSRTRHTLDEASQYLRDLGLATAIFEFLPGAVAAKVAADAAAVSATLATTNTTMAVLVENSFENAARVREQIAQYDAIVESAAPGVPSAEHQQPGGHE